jgi:hypothetical protein
MKIVPMRLGPAKELVAKYHRHHKPPLGGLFAIGLEDGGEVVGGVIVGRPVARMLDDGLTVEVTRLTVKEGHANGCSMLYSAAARAAKAMGYVRIITYILESEPGTSLKATGWKCEGKAGGGCWSRESRPREDDHPIEFKQRWSLNLS